MAALCTSSLSTPVSLRGVGVNFVGGIAIVLLDAGHDENKLKNSEDHTAHVVAAATGGGNRGPS